MPIALISESPLFFLAWILAILVGLSTHEFAHALVATKLGDPTPSRMGRLTLNPIAHIDPIGFFALVLIGFGWAKPVPFNPFNLIKAPRWGPTIVAFAGPLTNLFNVAVFIIVLKGVNNFFALPAENLAIQFLVLLILINVILFVFNFIPIPPLDGSKLLYSILSSPKYDELKYKLETRGPIILIAFLLLDSFLGLHFLGRFLNLVINFVFNLV